MIEEITAGDAASSASHCASKSGSQGASAAFSGTGGPKRPRKSRTARSRAASRAGGGSGIQRLSCTAPLLRARNSAAQAAMASGAICSAPQPPMPPAFATAAARAGGQAPAIGACRIGTRRPYRAQNSAARPRAVAGREAPVALVGCGIASPPRVLAADARSGSAS
jgi:hypothetical protein